ncbi:MAG: hypothetical protein ACFFD4_11430 [Candidatus Odinarchaeota archaeon]
MIGQIAGTYDDSTVSQGDFPVEMRKSSKRSIFIDFRTPVDKKPDNLE